MNINYDWTTQAHEQLIHGNVVITVQLIDNTRTGKRKSGKEVYERKGSQKKQAKKRKLKAGKNQRLLSSGSDNDSNDDDSSEGDEDLVVPKKKRKPRGKKAKAANANKVVSLDTSPGNMFFSLFWTVGKGCTNSGY